MLLMLKFSIISCSQIVAVGMLNGDTKLTKYSDPDGKVHGAHMQPTWGRQDPGGPHVGPVNIAVRGVLLTRSVLI